MWANLVKRFDLRRLWTDDAPEYADLDLALADGLVLIPTLRPDVIERYERTTGDLELDIPRPGVVALDLAETMHPAERRATRRVRPVGRRARPG